jgi:hypothetical protein
MLHGDSDLVRVNCGVVAEPEWDPASRVARMSEGGSTISMHSAMEQLTWSIMVYPRDDLVSTDEGMTGRPSMALGQVVDGELVDPTRDGAGEGQIGSGTL